MNWYTGSLPVLLRTTRLLLLEVVGTDFPRTSLTLLAMFFTSILSYRANDTVMTQVVSLKLLYNFYGTLRYYDCWNWPYQHSGSVVKEILLEAAGFCVRISDDALFLLWRVQVNFLRQKCSVETILFWNSAINSSFTHYNFVIFFISCNMSHILQLRTKLWHRNNTHVIGIFQFTLLGISVT